MILGCGLDLIEVERFETELSRRGPAILDDLFTARERAAIEAWPRPARGFAAGFAVKEACFKALGTGKIGRMAWRDLEVTWEGVVPVVTMTGESGDVAAGLGVDHVHVALSIGHLEVVAWAILEGVGR
jgi:holo-[acyl-carrier protein] synthase